jgi:hypothetical protein
MIPVFCSVERTPFAIPRRWGTTLWRIDALFGVTKLPMPRPSIHRQAASGPAPMAGCSKAASSASAPAASSRPATQMASGVKRRMRLPAVSAAINIPSATGAMRMPASDGARPAHAWRYRATSSSGAACDIDRSRMPAYAVRRPESLNNAGSTKGLAVRCCTLVNKSRAQTPESMKAHTGVLAQPRVPTIDSA